MVNMTLEEMVEKLQELWDEMQLTLHRTANGKKSTRYKIIERDYELLLGEYFRRKNLNE